MAEATVNETPQLFETPRGKLALSAAYEIDALARRLPGTIEPTVNADDLVVRGVCSRIVQLSEVIMQAVGDDSVSDSQLEYTINYCHPDRRV